MPTAPKSKPSAAAPAKKVVAEPLQSIHVQQVRRIAEGYRAKQPPTRPQPRNRQEAFYSDAPRRPRRSSLFEE